jgi:phosphatidate phosphatase APP1
MTRSLKEKIYELLKISPRPVVKAYDGYGDADDVLVYGHVLRLSPMPRKNYRHRLLVNFFSLIRLFMVRAVVRGRVLIEWNGETRETATDNEGHFKFEWKPVNAVTPGWSKARVYYISHEPQSVPLATAECDIFVPHQYQYNFVSDIDDTFLVSHSTELLKRLKVLFTHNARSRKPFADVVEHYRLLSQAAATNGVPNPFFYVSSSEWNLYDYIREFCRQQGLPKGVFLLSEIKKLGDLLNTGQGKHKTKFYRIARVLKSYPNHNYVLLGDNTQEDPSIYYAIAKDFPGMVGWIYIRNVSPKRHLQTKELISRIEALGVRCCYFTDSAEAIRHSVETGLTKEAV